MIVKERMQGTSTKKDEIIGFFKPGSYSSRFSFLEHLEEETLIRIDNKQNILSKFKELDGKIPSWGDDLGSYCERYICEEIYKKPVFVYYYPTVY